MVLEYSHPSNSETSKNRCKLCSRPLPSKKIEKPETSSPQTKRSSVAKAKRVVNMEEGEQTRNCNIYEEN